MAPYSGSRTITLIVAIATLTSNILSALFFYQLPDDPYHLASNFGWYLHFANLLSVFGFIGALRQHAPSVAIFANYLILDTLLSTIPRFLILLTITSFSSSLCQPSTSINFTMNQHSSLPDITSPSPATSGSDILYALAPIQPPHSEYLTQEDFTPESCMRTVYLGQLMLGAGVVVATVLQLVGALCVRGYARALWVREMREEEAAAALALANGGDLEAVEAGFRDERFFDEREGKA